MKRVISVLLVVLMLVSLCAFNAFAGSSDYSLTGAEVNDTSADATVEIPLSYAADCTYYSLQATWTVDAPLTLTALTAGGTASPMENDPATGHVVWMDTSFLGFDVAAGAPVWTATVTVPAGTADGEYSVKLHIDSITGFDGAADVEDMNFDLTAVVKVAGSSVTPVTTEKVEAKAATCTEAGNIEYYKGSDGKYYADAEATTEIALEDTVIPATGHTPAAAVVENEVAATCTAAGSYDEVVYCTVCGAEISRESKTVEALGHDWGAWVDNGDSTETRTCSRCGETETQPIAVVGDYALTGAEVTDTSADVTVDIPLSYKADCTFYSLQATWTVDAPLTLSALTAGGTASPMENDPATGRVVWMDTSFLGFDVAAGAPVWTATVTVPAGTADGEYSVKLHIDSITGFDGVADVEDMNIDVTAVVKVASGVVTPVTTEKVEAKAATCTEAGNIEYYKGSDGKYYADAEATTEITLESTVIPATGHTPAEPVVENEVAATCTAAGSYDEVVYCTVCGAEISRESKTIEALGHDWGEWVDNGDETETRTCARCGETETRAIPAEDHVEAKEATCTADGNIEYWVKDGKYYADAEYLTEIALEDTVIAALGHAWNAGVVTKTATCKAEGETVYTCTRCGETKTEAIDINPNAHVWGTWTTNPDGSMDRECTLCGKTEHISPVPPAPPVVVEPTYTLSFETNGGSTIAAVSGKSGDVIDLAAYKPTFEGKSFYAWYADAELTSKVTSITLAKNTTVYAFWLPFSDVTADAWYIDELAALKPLGLFEGVDSAIFDANGETTRGMIVTTLYKLAGSPDVTGEMAFSDLTDESAYYYKAVLWATANGIAKGYEDGTFKADRSVSRQELVCFLYRYAAFKGYNVTGRADLAAKYTDGDAVAAWAAEEMAWAVDAGLVKGMSDTVLQPAGTGTHAQWAALLVRVAALGD